MQVSFLWVMLVIVLLVLVSLAFIFERSGGGALAMWSIEEIDACFIVRDGNGQQVAYVFE
jgi:hypothetical protein